MEAGPLLEVRGLARHFGGVVALAGVDLSVEAGSIVGLIGPNGAGKTTLFNVISGVLKPHGGEVLFAGQDITGQNPDRITHAGLVRTFQIARGLPTLTVLENLLLYGEDQPGETFWQAILRPPAVARQEILLRERAFDIMGRLELAAAADQAASDLSGGQKKLLELGRALMRRPKMMLLDEPAAGVNPALAKRLAAHILACREGGITFLVIEHNMGLIAELCDRVIVMAEGRVLAQGPFEAIRNDHEVQTAYMGRRA